MRITKGNKEVDEEAIRAALLQKTPQQNQQHSQQPEDDEIMMTEVETFGLCLAERCYKIQQAILTIMQHAIAKKFELIHHTVTVLPALDQSHGVIITMHYRKLR